MKGLRKGDKEAAAAFLLSGTSSPVPRAQRAQRHEVLIRVDRLRALATYTALYERALSRKALVKLTYHFSLKRQATAATRRGWHRQHP